MATEATARMRLRVIRLGRMAYDEALALQETLQQRRLEEQEEVLLLVKHPPVLTLGRHGQEDNVLISETERSDLGVPLVRVGRGGDVTYHGPGQLVGYPILKLNRDGMGIREYIAGLQDVFVGLLRDTYGIAAHPETGRYTGVWVGEDKITAIGISVRHWVTMHGFAFNMNTDLSHFGWIRPCGLEDRGVTSLQRLLGGPVDFDRVTDQVQERFCDVFDAQAETWSREQLRHAWGI